MCGTEHLLPMWVELLPLPQSLSTLTVPLPTVKNSSIPSNLHAPYASARSSAWTPYPARKCTEQCPECGSFSSSSPLAEYITCMCYSQQPCLSRHAQAPDELALSRYQCMAPLSHANHLSSYNDASVLGGSCQAMPVVSRYQRLTCCRCNRTFEPDVNYIDLTLTSGMRKRVYQQKLSTGTELFRYSFWAAHT